ncbi:hypothetical protein BaRGS_00035443 [Batillaria attramentaria]|uniref:Uncharacterized protein n=1 Tax=Batillaria attramentaria TaxID=370345 RepID=A0ABD0JFD8_9CAEN
MCVYRWRMGEEEGGGKRGKEGGEEGEGGRVGGGRGGGGGLAGAPGVPLFSQDDQCDSDLTSKVYFVKTEMCAVRQLCASTYPYHH